MRTDCFQLQFSKIPPQTHFTNVRYNSNKIKEDKHTSRSGRKVFSTTEVLSSAILPSSSSTLMDAPNALMSMFYKVCPHGLTKRESDGVLLGTKKDGHVRTSTL